MVRSLVVLSALLWFCTSAGAQTSPQPGAGALPPPFTLPVPTIPAPSFNSSMGGFGLTPVEVWWWLDPYWTWYYPWLNSPVWWNGVPVPVAVPYPYVVPYPYAVPMPYGVPVPVNPTPAKPQPPQDDLEARAKMDMELRAGNADFATGDFQRALKRYEAAAFHMPLDPLPLFHQGQAHFALGQYSRAVVVIQRGLKWKADWAQSEFQPRSLYGSRSAAYQRHLAQLAEQVEKHPHDTGLLFLLGYQLWFDGKRDQALPLLRRAAALSMESDHLTGFLKK